MTTFELREKIWHGDLSATTADLREIFLENMCELGKRYLKDGNVDATLCWLNAAAKLGSDSANFELGKIYSYGDYMPKDYPKAAEYFEKSGDDLYNAFDEIYYNFGDMYRYGDGVEKNIEKAIKWYEAQEHCGDYDERRDAIFALAKIYRDGEGDIKTDGEKAVRYLMELAFDSGDYFFLTDAKIYEDAQNVPMSYDEQVYFSSFDASHGDDEAKFMLGCMYLYGQAVEKDVYKAAWWFAHMYELDCYDNGEIFDLAEKYRTGDGVEKNIDIAIAWYEKIVKWWNTKVDKALFSLAEIYFHGDGVEQDIDKALDYYEKAANCGNIKAAYRLSEIYFNGTGVEQDLEEARHYLDKTIKCLKDKI